MAAKRLPKKLRIGYADFSVLCNKGTDPLLIEDGLAGASNGNLHRIAVRSDLPELNRIETLLHEVLHQVLYVAGQQNEDKLEERIVRTMAMGLIQVFRDNPELLALLTFQE